MMGLTNLDWEVGNVARTASVAIQTSNVALVSAGNTASSRTKSAAFLTTTRAGPAQPNHTWML
jgi:hypothetical protein